MQRRGWDAADFICVTGDAYVDHPSFGIAITARVLEAEGFRVGMIAQPLSDADFMIYGRPKHAFFVTSGNIDSMVAHYTVAKRKRSDDFYSPGGKAGRRPDRAVITYCKTIRRLYPDVPIIIGGLEASLRRFAHYDYWDDAVRPSILADSGADLLIFGMGENQTRQIANRLAAGERVEDLHDIRGICYLTQLSSPPEEEHVSCASYEKVRENKLSYAKACKLQIDEQDAVIGRAVVQKHGDRLLVQNRPMPPLSTEELDAVAALPYMRYYHPSYEQYGGVPAIEEVEFSVIHNRGCFGNCNFCSIAFHQGRQITSRSKESILAEASEMVQNPRFKGYIHDVGGPTANFRNPSCKKQLTKGFCKDRRCLAPSICPAVKVDHSEYLDILRALREMKGVKKVFIRSGIRYDYLIHDKDDRFMRELVEHHVSGQLKVAPEHCSAAVLDRMGKPHIEAYNQFMNRFYSTTKKIGKEQYLVPYLMSSHPGSTLRDAVQLAQFLKKHKIRPEQVQDFYPTPGTVSTCMFYTGLDPHTLQPVFVPKSQHEKAMQRALLQYFKPQNRALVAEALYKAGRSDLIGTGPDCLIGPDRSRPQEKTPERNHQNGGRGSWRDSGGGRYANGNADSAKGAKRNASIGGSYKRGTNSGKGSKDEWNSRGGSGTRADYKGGPMHAGKGRGKPYGSKKRKP